jgi:hypothetical protein
MPEICGAEIIFEYKDYSIITNKGIGHKMLNNCEVTNKISNFTPNTSNPFLQEKFNSC